jgi:hypothetical protein
MGHDSAQRLVPRDPLVAGERLEPLGDALGVVEPIELEREDDLRGGRGALEDGLHHGDDNEN